MCLQYDNVTLDRNFTSFDLARMMSFLRYGHYPPHRYQDVKSGGPSLEEWLQAAVVTRVRDRADCRDAKDPFDPGHLHLRMLRVANYYRIPDLTKYCLGMLEEYMKEHPGFVWEIVGFRKKYTTCAGNEDLRMMNRRVFAENAKRFVKEERFKMVVKSDPGFAWAVMYLMAQKMK